MNHKGARHLTWEKRLVIERMLKEKFSKSAIAKAVGVSLRTVYYEIRRGMCTQITSDYEFVNLYSPDTAERKYQENLRAKGPQLKIGKDHKLANYIEHKIIEEGYSPGAVLGEIKIQKLPFSVTICESTLYNYVYRGDVFLQLTPCHLQEKGRRHNYQGIRPQAARPPKGDSSIEDRPGEIAARTTFGHWEMDSVIGSQESKKTLLVLIERLTRMCLIRLLPDHTMESVVKVINQLERRFGGIFYKVFQSITVDNGSEFQDFQGLENARRRKGRRTRVYYCHPYTPSERGSNENLNRIVRRFFPKGSNFDKLTAKAVEKAQDWINSYPRRLLGWHSAKDLFQQYAAALAAE